MCFFKVKHYFAHILGMVGPIDVKQKRKCSGWTLGLICDLDLWPHSWPWPFLNSCISGIVGLIDVKWKGSKLIGYWADYMTLPSHHTHDLDLGVSGSESYLRNVKADWHGTKMMWVIHSWPWYWPVWLWWGERKYRIVTGVTSDIGVPSTYLEIHEYQFPLTQY